MNRLDRLAFLMLAVLNDEQEPEPQEPNPPKEKRQATGTSHREARVSSHLPRRTNADET